MKESAVKDKIVDVATRLFYNQGYNLTGINQVIKEADIARASLYNHFESKTDLLLAYLEKFNDDWFAGLDAFLEPISDPKKKVLALFDYRMSSQQKLGFGGCASIKINDEVGGDDARITEIVRRNKHTLKSRILKLVLAVKHKQILSTAALADMIYLLMEGGVTSASIFKSKHDLENGKMIAAQLL